MSCTKSLGFEFLAGAEFRPKTNLAYRYLQHLKTLLNKTKIRYGHIMIIIIRKFQIISGY